MQNQTQIGLGFRREIADAFLDGNVNPDFIEVAVENWVELGGYWGDVFRKVTDKLPLIVHGLSLSIGSPEELDYGFLKQVKTFLKTFDVKIYSEHLSFAKFENAHLFDLLPIPFRQDSVKHIALRIRQVQDFLGIPLAIENVSYYTSVEAEMTEHEFINEIVDASGCNLLLDVNNVFVNGFNHNYDPYEFIDKMPLDKVSYIHMAGHKRVAPDLIIDTHGEAIIEPVYHLFDYTLSKMSKTVPVLLERDFNFPEIGSLKSELSALRQIANKNQKNHVIH